MGNKTKVCKYCRTEIDAKAKICPNCKKKQSSAGCLFAILIALVVLVCMGIMLGGSGGGSNSDRQADIVSVAPAEGTGEGAAVPTIDEQVLWEFDGVKMTATGIDKTSAWGAAVNVLIENDSDTDVGISVDDVIVNDYMLANLDGFTVTAGNKKNGSIDLFRTELQAAGIENIGKIELYMHSYDPETYEEKQSSGCITITTSDAAAADSSVELEGTTLFDAEGVKIIGKYVNEDSFWGQAILFYVENNSDHEIIVETEDTAVNGYMIADSLYKHVYAGKKTIGRLYVYSTELEENGITSVDTVQTTFRILDTNYNEIANSGKVDLTVSH